MWAKVFMLKYKQVNSIYFLLRKYLDEKEAYLL